MTLKIPFFKISKNKKLFLSHVPMILQSKNQVPRPKGVLCSSDADRQTDRHESEYRGHPFRVSGFFKFSFNLSSRSGPKINGTSDSSYKRV